MSSQDYILWRQRKRIAMQVVSECGNIQMVAERWGVTNPAARKQLMKRWPSIYEALRSGRPRHQLHPHRVLHRLRVTARHGNQGRAAKELGIDRMALRQFLNRYAPDGLDEALALYEENYAAPLLEAAA